MIGGRLESGPSSPADAASSRRRGGVLPSCVRLKIRDRKASDRMFRASANAAKTASRRRLRIGMRLRPFRAWPEFKADPVR